MATRTVRLDEETERTLQEIREATGMSISEVFKRGILAFREEVAKRASRAPFEIYRGLELGPGGYAIAPSSDVRRGVRESLRRKHRR